MNPQSIHRLSSTDRMYRRFMTRRTCRDSLNPCAIHFSVSADGVLRRHTHSVMRYTFNGTLRRRTYPPLRDTPHHRPPPRIHTHTHTHTHPPFFLVVYTFTHPSRSVSRAHIPTRGARATSSPRVVLVVSLRARNRTRDADSGVRPIDRSIDRPRARSYRSRVRGRRDARTVRTNERTTDSRPPEGVGDASIPNPFHRIERPGSARRDARSKDAFAFATCRNDWCPRACSRMCFKSTS